MHVRVMYVINWLNKLQALLLFCYNQVNEKGLLGKRLICREAFRSF